MAATIVKGAIGYSTAHPNGTPKAADTQAWDAAKEVSAATADVLPSLCAWYDADNKDKKSAYKFPHHLADGKHAVVWAGVSAAMAALNGARGGTSIPSTDRRGVYNHLVKHYKEFDKEPPELKDFFALDDEDDEIVARQQVSFSALFGEVETGKAADTAIETRTISGFVSLNTEDRDGDVIDPALFDLQTYLKNPQLWVNHQLWKDKNGNGKSVGSTSELHTVRVLLDDEGEQATLYDMVNDGILHTVDAKEFILKNNSKGLWVVAEVVEPEVIKLVDTKRLNAFSWQGVIHRRKSGAIARIDLFEISLVNVPANHRALFRIGKMFSIETENGTVVKIDLDAVNALAPSDVKQDDEPLTEFEQKLLDMCNAPTEQNDTSKGGDTDMALTKEQEDMLKAIAEQGKTLPGIAESVTALVARVDGLEAKAAEAAAATEDKETKKDETDAEDKKALTPEPSESDQKILDTLTALGESLKALPTIEKTMEALSARVGALETKPSTSKAASGEDEGEALTQLADVREAVQKRMRDMQPAERKVLQRHALGNALIPDGVTKTT